MKIFTLLALLLSLGTAFAQENDAFARANQDYAGGNFREAIEGYEGLVRGGSVDATVFYDLGNAYFRAQDFGRAILNYERALALEPRHPEATANLVLVRDKAHALELRLNRFDRLTSGITATQYSVVAALSFWIALFALAGLFLARRRSSAAGIVLALALLALGVAGYGLYALETGPAGSTLAIVVAKNADARLATADSAATVLTLPPGSQVKILSTRGEWSYAVLPNELRGWIPAQSAERVRL